MQTFKNFRSYFLKGTAALLPTILTIWIFVQCYVFVQDKVSIHINRGLVNLILLVTDQWNREFLDAFWVDGPGRITGFFVAIVGVCFLGAFLASFVGHRIWHYVEKLLVKAPLIRLVYPYIKQVTDFLLSNKSLEFNKVVALEYPRKGTWSIGLVTGKGLPRVVQKNAGCGDFLTVFVPTSPTPFTGYVIMVPKNETIEMDISIEQALRFVISGGVISPLDYLGLQESPGHIEKNSNSVLSSGGTDDHYSHRQAH